MVDKHLEVIKWLGELIPKSEILTLNINDKNIDVFHKFMLDFIDLQTDMDHVINKCNSITKQNIEKTEIICDILNSLQIKTNNFEQDTKDCYEYLISLFFKLNLQNISSTNFILAISTTEKEHLTMCSELKVEKDKTDILLKSSQNVDNNLCLIKNIRKDKDEVAILKEAEYAKDIKRTKFSEEKINDYSIDVSRLEKKLEYAGYEPQLTQSTVMEKWNELQILEGKLDDAKQLLCTYNLPPDYSLAKLKVEETRKKLSDAMGKLTNIYGNT